MIIVSVSFVKVDMEDKRLLIPVSIVLLVILVEIYNNIIDIITLI